MAKNYNTVHFNSKALNMYVSFTKCVTLYIKNVYYITDLMIRHPCIGWFTCQASMMNDTKPAVCVTLKTLKNFLSFFHHTQWHNLIDCVAITQLLIHS